MSTPRRKSKPVHVGDVQIGGDAPVAVQSMCSTDTGDVRATVDELKRRDRWVIWTLVADKNGRKTKVPLQCRTAHKEYRQEHRLRFYRASSTDPETWTWENAATTLRRYLP